MVETEFATPSRPISREQFTSLKQRVATDSPKLYKNKVLSGPNEKVKTQTNHQNGSSDSLKNVSTTAASKSTSNLDLNVTSELPKATPSLVETGKIGSFENPVLHTLAQRTVNKEWETQRLIVNIIAWAIWDLMAKFFNTLAKHSKIGRQLVLWINRELIPSNSHSSSNISHDRGNNISSFFKGVYDRYPSFWEKLNWSNLNLLFHLIVVVNILVSLWRLFSKVKTDDLQLNENQRQLLGVVDQYSNFDEQHDDYLHHHEQLVKGPELISSRESNATPPEPPNTPFLFKSLETPMKSRQKKEFVNDSVQNVTQSAFVNRLNAFGLSPSFGNRLNSNSKGVLKPDIDKLFPASMAATPAGKTGYIPSSKYTYMMNSPTPRKNT